MEIKKKEIGENIILNFDKANYRKFLEEIKRLGQKYEAQSNYKKIKHSIVFNARKKPYMNVKGWCSRVINPSGKIDEVVFADYDRILFDLMYSELLYIQEKYNLTPFYIFTTFEDKNADGSVYGNYLAISPSKKNFKEVGEILEELHCDNSYKVVPKSYSYSTWVLRLGSKGKKSAPAFKCIIGDLSKDYIQPVSEAHAETIEKLYPQTKGLIKYKNLDGLHKVYLSEYMTASS